MKITELIEKTGWKVLAGDPAASPDAEGVYCGDLLSWVMGNGEPGQVWITVQVHLNVVAVAMLREFSCLVIADGAEPAPQMLEKAADEGLTVLASDMPVYETAVMLREAGI
ncbi:MAG: AraC family transcriptional regulator [Oscillospiraceae bacterium]|jgi:hypothetical protein|nr:AraC family transcriptional regulator [Oscillospiraceae bacterium]MBP1556244.1 AraC family transcriptional regulator [Oscillospiraceae bacterium]